MNGPTKMARDVTPFCVRANQKLVIGGTGAVASFRGMWLRDVSAPPVRTGAGTYLITFDRSFIDMVGFKGAMLQPGASLEVIVSADNSTTGAITIQTVNSSGTPTDPASGNVIYLEEMFQLEPGAF